MDVEGRTGGEAPGSGAQGAETLGRAELRDIIDAVDEAVIIFDDAGNVLSMNPAGRQLHGCVDGGCAMRHDEYVARYQVELPGGGAPLPADERPLARALGGEAVHDIELSVRDAETGRRWVGLYSAVPLVSAEGRTPRDGDDPRRHRAASARSRRCATRTGARTSTSRCSRTSCGTRSRRSGARSSSSSARTPRRTERAGAREVIARQVGHLARMVDDLLDVSRIARGQDRAAAEPARPRRARPARRGGPPAPPRRRAASSSRSPPPRRP